MDKKLRQEIYQCLNPNKALDPYQPDFAEFYQNVYELPGCEDQIALLKQHIELSYPESLQLFSGFRGSGKTTELFRLRRQLQEAGYLVLYADALEYLNPAEPIEISDLLIVLAGAFGEAIDKHDAFTKHPQKLVQRSFWGNFTDFLRRMEITAEPTANVSLETPLSKVVGGLKAGVDLKLALKTSPGFRQDLQKMLENRLVETKSEVNKFFEAGIKAIETFFGAEKEVVFIFDSLEQLRGSRFNEQDVLRSVERLFSNHLGLLGAPYVHMIYTVPPWLKFVKTGGLIRMLPNVRQWSNTPSRVPFAAGCDALVELLRKRFGVNGFKQFFGPDETTAKAQASKLADVCGGHFRLLLRLARESVLRSSEWPVSDSVLQSAVAEVKRDFLPIAVDDARWLAQIEKSRDANPPTNSPDNVGRLTRFLDTHFVLYLKNGEDWYDIHPLIREDVKEIVERHPETPAVS